MIIGLIGGSGSGKSEVANVLREDFGAYIISADKIGHEVIKKGNPSYVLLIQFFGEDIIGMDGEIDRRILGQKAFRNEECRLALNTMTRPYIFQEIQRMIIELKQIEHSFIVIDAEGIIEANMAYVMDEVWSVSAPLEIRKKRLLENRGYTMEKINSIINLQNTEEYYKHNSSFQILNNGTVEHIKTQIKNKLSVGGKE